MNTLDSKEQAQAIALRFQLCAIDGADVPIMSTERGIPRKIQSKLARELFRRLGLKGISVTAPNYSMAQSVDVSLPKRSDYVLDACGFVIDGDDAAKANNEVRGKIESILADAFPNHDNRSDSQSDYFDFCWSVS